MQLGFSQAVERTATLVLGKLDFDILIVSKSYVFLAAPGSFPLARIRTAESVPGVVSVVPLYVRPGRWQNLSNETAAEGLDWLLSWLPSRHSERRRERAGGAVEGEGDSRSGLEPGRPHFRARYSRPGTRAGGPRGARGSPDRPPQP